jgi:hypothetical protein
VEFDFVFEGDDPLHMMFVNAWLSGGTLDLWITDGDGEGVRAFWSVTRCNISQELDGPIKASVTLKPARDHVPEWLSM